MTFQRRNILALSNELELALLDTLYCMVREQLRTLIIYSYTSNRNRVTVKCDLVFLENLRVL